MLSPLALPLPDACKRIVQVREKRAETPIQKADYADGEYVSFYVLFCCTDS